MKARNILAFILVATILIMGTSIALMQETIGYPASTDSEWDVLTEINHWRVRRGLLPLARNKDLDELALLQAQYIIPQAPFTTKKVDFHTDQYGDGVIGRAQLFGWPYYDTEERILASEIAAYYPDVAGAINFWQHSEIHRKSVETPGFREAGVAVLRKGNWLLSYVVLGGRPDVLPVLYDAKRNVVFMATDKSYFSDKFRPTKMRFLDLAGNILHDPEWLPWSEKYVLPSWAQTEMTVVVTDGIKEIETQFNMTTNLAFPSDPIPTPAPTSTPRPTATPLAVTLTPTVVPNTPTPSPTPVSNAFTIKLTWDDETMTLVNQSDGPVDLTRLVMISKSLGFQKTGEWMGAYSQVSLEAFPPNYCIQLWSLEYSLDTPNLPADCIILASGRSILRANERFWMAKSFEVRYDNETVAVCDTRNDICEFDLPNQ